MLAYATERLLEAGALDVTLQPVMMKKGRPGTLLQVVAKPGAPRGAGADHLRGNLRAGAAHVRPPSGACRRATWTEVETTYGKVRMKVSSEGSYAPEYEDCRKLALAIRRRH